MQHLRKNRTLSRTTRQRTALLRSLMVALVRDGKIKTSEAKAKELRPFAERLVTHAKEGTLAARRKVATKLGEPQNDTLKKLFDEIAPKYQDRPGGYTRVIKMGRTAAGRDEALIEFVE